MNITPAEQMPTLASMESGVEAELILFAGSLPFVGDFVETCDVELVMEAEG